MDLRIKENFFGKSVGVLSWTPLWWRDGFCFPRLKSEDSSFKEAPKQLHILVMESVGSQRLKYSLDALMDEWTVSALRTDCTCFWISEGKEYWFYMVQRITGKCELAWSYSKTAWEENGTTENLRKLQITWPKNKGTKEDSQTEGRDFSELYSPPNPHLNIGRAPNRVKSARHCS